MAAVPGHQPWDGGHLSVLVDVRDADGPVNVAVGEDNNQYALEDESTNYEDSFNTETTVEDSFNSLHQESNETTYEDNDTHTSTVEDSFNTAVQDNDLTSWTQEESWTDRSSHEDNDSWVAETEIDLDAVEVWGDDNMIDAD